MRALQRLGVPTLLFVNKIDRAGADDERVLRAISRAADAGRRPDGIRSRARHARRRVHALRRRRPGFAAAARRRARRPRRRDAGRVRRDEASSPTRGSAQELAAQTARSLVHPVFFGSALTGAGVESLMAGIAELLPAAAGDADGPVSGTVFKVERGPAGEKIAYARMFAGTVRTRDRLQFGEAASRR